MISFSLAKWWSHKRIGLRSIVFIDVADLHIWKNHIKGVFNMRYGKNRKVADPNEITNFFLNVVDPHFSINVTDPYVRGNSVIHYVVEWKVKEMRTFFCQKIKTKPCTVWQFCQNIERMYSVMMWLTHMCRMRIEKWSSHLKKKKLNLTDPHTQKENRRWQTHLIKRILNVI